ncbi:MAG: hypothetical protein EOM67_08130 [Spirochaetia bacterium]|nr:hypothetical protein [Spirochaetia bacterium]
MLVRLIGLIYAVLFAMFLILCAVVTEVLGELPEVVTARFMVIMSWIIVGISAWKEFRKKN